MKNWYEVKIGEKYNNLLVIGESTRKNGARHFECKCDCGNITVVRKFNILNGITKSCGCLKLIMTKKINTTHGMTKTPLYQAWINMKARCLNKKHKAYDDYGGRGICVCDEWINDFNSFMNWANINGYDKTLTIERINVNGDYCPDNCSWIPMSDQLKNKRNTVRLSLNGDTRIISDWSTITGIGRHTIHCRIKRGWSAEKTLTTAVGNMGRRKVMD